MIAHQPEVTYGLRALGDSLTCKQVNKVSSCEAEQ